MTAWLRALWRSRTKPDEDDRAPLLSANELRRPRPDAEVRRLLTQLRSTGRPDPTKSIDVARREWQLAVKAFGSRRPVGTVTNHEIGTPDGSVGLRIYTPRGSKKPRPALVWFHGGGFVMGDLYTAGAICRSLVHHSGAVVVAVQYRLAPEHTLKEGRDDCLAAVSWLSVHGSELGIDGSRLAVGGDSAGGGIAALVAHECGRAGPNLRAQLLVYPATDLTGSHPSATESMSGLLTTEWMDWARALISTTSDLADPASSATRSGDLTCAPPTILLTAGFDPLRDEGLAYAAKLRSASVPVRLLHFPGQIHGFVSLDRVLAGGRFALQRLGQELAAAFEDDQLHGVIEPALPGRPVFDLRWLGPRQRWHEAKVVVLIIGERIRLLRSPCFSDRRNVPRGDRSRSTLGQVRCDGSRGAS